MGEDVEVLRRSILEGLKSGHVDVDSSCWRTILEGLNVERDVGHGSDDGFHGSEDARGGGGTERERERGEEGRLVAN